MKNMTFTGLEEENKAVTSKFMVYPNPINNGIINIKKLQYVPFDEVNIYDLTGNLIYTTDQITNDLDQYQIDISKLHLKPGLYVIHSATNEGPHYYEKVEIF